MTRPWSGLSHVRKQKRGKRMPLTLLMRYEPKCDECGYVCECDGDTTSLSKPENSKQYHDEWYFEGKKTFCEECGNQYFCDDCGEYGEKGHSYCDTHYEYVCAKCLANPKHANCKDD